MNRRQPAFNLVVAVALGAGLALALLTLLAPPIRPVTAAAMAREATSDLEISKADGVDTVDPGDTLTYTIAITNTGVQTATGVVLTDTLPLSTTFVGPTAHWQQVGSTHVYTHAVGDLEPGAGAYTTTLVVTVDTPLPAELEHITNTVQVTDASDAYAQDTDVNTVTAAPLPDGVITVCQEGLCDYTIIQDAVDAAEEGEEIRVASGTYTEVNNRGGLAQIVYLDKSVTLRGGYTTTDWITPDTQANPTTLDARRQGRVLYLAGDVTPTITGLRLISGTAQGLAGGPYGYAVGGGVYIGGGAPIITGCHVMSNTALWGGGLYLRDSDALIANNTIQGNEGLVVDSVPSRGGGLYLRSGRGVLAGNTIHLNRANWTWGGGVYLYDTEATLQANQLTGNVARIGGGAVHAWIGAPQFVHNLITANAAEWGGGMNLDHSEGTVGGNQVLSNTARYGGGGLCFAGSSASLSGNTVRSNQARFGGGMHLSRGTFELGENVLAANQATESGGALYMYDGDVALTNAMVVDNRSGVSAGGIQAWAGSLRLVHGTLARNHVVDGDGGGIYLLGGSTAALTNTILVGHSVAVYANGDTAVSLAHTLWGSGAWANGSDWAGPGLITHTDDYAGDPAFVDADAGDYHITSSSGAVNRAVDAGVYSDIDGYPRPLGGGFDLGADEYGEMDLSSSRKTVYPDQAVAQDVLTYTIVLLNQGDVSARDTEMVDPIPDHTTYMPGSASTTAGELTDGDSIRWTGTLTPHQPVTITFSVTLGQTSVVRNTAVVTDHQGGVTTLSTLVNGLRSYLPLIFH